MGAIAISVFDIIKLDHFVNLNPNPESKIFDLVGVCKSFYLSGYAQNQAAPIAADKISAKIFFSLMLLKF